MSNRIALNKDSHSARVANFVVNLWPSASGNNTKSIAAAWRERPLSTGSRRQVPLRAAQGNREKYPLQAGHDEPATNIAHILRLLRRSAPHR